MARTKPRPKRQSEILTGREEKLRRADTTSRKGDPVKDFTVTLLDIDSAIKYYFDNVIIPRVEENGEFIPVPVIYGSAEKWKMVRRDGYYRDARGTILAPIIMFKRTSIARNDNIPVDKLDANAPRLFYTFKKKYSQRNKYDKFSVLSGGEPEEEFYHVVIPDYVTISYEAIIWTEYIEQLNHLVEAINYSEGAYWGEKERFKFKVRIDDFSTETELGADEDRLVRANFTMTATGYLVPDTINKQLAAQAPNMKKTFSTRQIVISEHVDNTEIFDATPEQVEHIVSEEDTNIGRATFDMGHFNDIWWYLSNVSYRTTFNNSGSYEGDTGTSVSVFVDTAAATPPPFFPDQTDEDFIFFVNGQYIEHDVITILQSGNNFVAQFDEAGLGFELDDQDEVIVWGRFA